MNHFLILFEFPSCNCLNGARKIKVLCIATSKKWFLYGTAHCFDFEHDNNNTGIKINCTNVQVDDWTTDLHCWCWCSAMSAPMVRAFWFQWHGLMDFVKDNWWGGFDWQMYSSSVGSWIGLLVWRQSKRLHSLLFNGFHKLFLLPWQNASKEVFRFLYQDP